MELCKNEKAWAAAVDPAIVTRFCKFVEGTLQLLKCIDGMTQ